jgi:hypothetical protein
MISKDEASRLEFRELAPTLRGYLDSLKGRGWGLPSRPRLKQYRELLERILELIEVLSSKVKTEVEQRIALNIRHAYEAAEAHALALAEWLAREMALPRTRAVVRIPWELLPPGELGRRSVSDAVRRLKRENPGRRVDAERLAFAWSLAPESVYKGVDVFDTYLAFLYKRGRGVRVLLENPVEGNAAYIFGHDWKRLSRLSKSELLEEHSSRLARVQHVGDWKARIREAVGSVAGRKSKRKRR